MKTAIKMAGTTAQLSRVSGVTQAILERLNENGESTSGNNVIRGRWMNEKARTTITDDAATRALELYYEDGRSQLMRQRFGRNFDRVKKTIVDFD